MSPVRQLKKPPPKPRNHFEQNLWDEVLRMCIGRGDNITSATNSADYAIARRRTQGSGK